MKWVEKINRGARKRCNLGLVYNIKEGVIIDEDRDSNASGERDTGLVKRKQERVSAKMGVLRRGAERGDGESQREEKDWSV